VVAGCPRGPYDVGTRATFADLGATVLDLLGVAAPLAIGASFAADIGLG
jgi:phosphopentomutase